jgi:riboflavin kinase
MENAGAPYSIRLRGRYVKGLGRSGIFLSTDIYKEILRRRLGEDPYPGTLNIEMEGLEGYEELKKICPPQEKIEDTVIGGKAYGGLYIWKAYMEGNEVLVIRPYRSTHKPTVLEIVSRKKLIEKLKIDEGTAITISVECSPKQEI